MAASAVGFMAIAVIFKLPHWFYVRSVCNYFECCLPCCNKFDNYISNMHAQIILQMAHMIPYGQNSRHSENALRRVALLKVKVLLCALEVYTGKRTIKLGRALLA